MHKSPNQRLTKWLMTPTKFKSVARCMMEFPDIESCLFLQQGQLVWSEVKPDVTKLLVHYLTTTLLPSLTTSSPQSSSTVTHQVQISKFSTSLKMFKVIMITYFTVLSAAYKCTLPQSWIVNRILILVYCLFRILVYSRFFFIHLFNFQSLLR